MEKPEDIPQGVWDRAEKAGEAMYGRHERGFVMWPLISENGNPAKEIIARAILSAVEEEREAIMSIVDGFGATWAAESIALNIRNRKGA